MDCGADRLALELDRPAFRRLPPAALGRYPPSHDHDSGLLIARPSRHLLSASRSTPGVRVHQKHDFLWCNYCCDHNFISIQINNLEFRLIGRHPIEGVKRLFKHLCRTLQQSLWPATAGGPSGILTSSFEVLKSRLSIFARRRTREQHV